MSTLALVALIFSSLFTVDQRGFHDVDQILLYGDSFYLNAMHDGHQGNQVFFIASDLPRFSNYTGLSLRIQYQFDTIK